MKVFFTINDKSDYHYDLLKACVKSIKQNTSLEPFCIYHDSDQNHEIYKFLQSNNVGIIPHKLTFYDQICNKNFDSYELNDFYADLYKNHKHLHNTNLLIMESVRIDIPRVIKEHGINDKYILYCDTDVLFIDDFKVSEFNEPIGAACRNKYFNNGVMVFNTDQYNQMYDEFKQFYINNNFNFKTFWGSQGAFNEFFNDSTYNIGVENNWHVFWGINNNAKIIHFCGLKPKDYELIYNNKIDEYTEWFVKLATNNRQSIQHYMEVIKNYYEQ